LIFNNSDYVRFFSTTRLIYQNKYKANSLKTNYALGIGYALAGMLKRRLGFSCH